jgi:folate-dependent phosphoribosylglycinamide formyltransferase PurN
MAPRPRLLIFASGTDTDGGSGFENLVAASRDGRLTADIVGVVSNHEHGGVSKRAKRLGIPFFFFPDPTRRTSIARLSNIRRQTSYRFPDGSNS